MWNNLGPLLHEHIPAPCTPRWHPAHSSGSDRWCPTFCYGRPPPCPHQLYCHPPDAPEGGKLCGVDCGVCVSWGEKGIFISESSTKDGRTALRKHMHTRPENAPSLFVAKMHAAYSHSPYCRLLVINAYITLTLKRTILTRDHTHFPSPLQRTPASSRCTQLCSPHPKN